MSFRIKSKIKSRIKQWSECHLESIYIQIILWFRKELLTKKVDLFQLKNKKWTLHLAKCRHLSKQNCEKWNITLYLLLHHLWLPERAWVNIELFSSLSEEPLHNREALRRVQTPPKSVEEWMVVCGWSGD